MTFQNISSRARAIKSCRVAGCLVTGLLVATAESATLRVGPNQPLKKISDAAWQAQDGDVVEIHSGEYRNDVAVWTQKKLTIRGVGKRPILVTKARSAESKAIWVIRNGEFEIENIEFRGARVKDNNGAGIRFERGRLTVRNCSFVDNQNGILTGNKPDTALFIYDSHFRDAPRQPGALTHLLYAGRIAKLVVHGSRFENGYEGHLIKSRARFNDIRYNWILDGPKGEASYEIDLPEGGIGFVVGNVIGQSRSSQNPTMIAFGAEGGSVGNGQLVINQNTLVSADNTSSVFLRIWHNWTKPPPQVVVSNNIFIGHGEFKGSEGVQFLGNHTVSASAFDTNFRPSADDAIRKTLSAPLPADLDGIPEAEYVAPAGRRRYALRAGQPNLIPGAFQFSD